MASPALDPDAQAGLKVAVQATPTEVGIDLANWNWKVVREFIEVRCGIRLCRSACTRYLHRLGFVCKRPKKRLLKADEATRAAFVAEYAALLAEARAAGRKIFFVDEAHFRADGDLRGKWVLGAKLTLVDSGLPALGREGQLLLGGLPGDRGGGAHGTDRHQHLRDQRRLPRAVARAPPRSARRDLGQRPGAWGRGGARLSGDAGPRPAGDPPPCLQP
ncbi:MAG: winged helix-turn-helix domain-containing protein [Chloroflexia bacterium]